MLAPLLQHATAVRGGFATVAERPVPDVRRSTQFARQAVVQNGERAGRVALVRPCIGASKSNLTIGLSKRATFDHLITVKLLKAVAEITARSA